MGRPDTNKNGRRKPMRSFLDGDEGPKEDPANLKYLLFHDKAEWDFYLAETKKEAASGLGAEPSDQQPWLFPCQMVYDPTRVHVNPDGVRAFHNRFERPNRSYPYRW